MDILEMSAKIATLCKSFVALIAGEWPDSSVFSEVVPQIAAFFEHTITIRILAFKEQLYSLCLLVFNLDCLVPLGWNTFKGFC